MTASDNRVWYCTREDVQASLKTADLLRTNRVIDRAISAASRSVEGLTHRVFFPWTGTRYFDWPSETQRDGVGVLWLDENELASASAIISGGATIAPGNYLLEPNASGPPYSKLAINRAGPSSFSAGDTSQRSIAITGTFAGCALNEDRSSSLALAVNSSLEQIQLNPNSSIGVGDILRIDTERVIVTEKLPMDTGQALGNDLAANPGARSLNVANGMLFAPGEMLYLGAERMAIESILGNTLIVRRAENGSLLAAHTTGEAIYAPRIAQVVRGALGTTAAAHLLASSAYRHLPPALVKEATLAQALVNIEQASSGYGRVVGSGDNAREARGAGLQAILSDLYTAYGRKARMRSV